MAIPGLSRTVFHLRNRMLILVLSPPLTLFCAARIYAAMTSGKPWLNWLAGLVLWLFLLFLALRRRLLVTPQGLEYTESFATINVPWAQMNRLVSRRMLGMWPVEGLEVWTATPKPEDRFIDLTQFGRSWRRGPLGATLRAMAPHLFKEPPYTRSAA